MSLEGKVAFITGGVKNLGALVARTFAAEGADLALHYHGSAAKEAADALALELQSSLPKIKVFIYQGDLAVAATVTEIYAAIVQDFGKLDVMVNTVGMVLKKPLIAVTEAEFDQMFAVNTKAAFLINQGAAKILTDGGRIINIVTSLLGAYTGGYSVYQGAKAPVEWFTKGLSKELQPRGITANAIAPGPMDTPFFYGQEDDHSVAFAKSMAIGGRLTKIEDVSPLIKFLAGPDGAWITGQLIFPNGGFTTR
ncbi:hypothetical protein AMS68_002263 [Peltaster fructicola]|uniref:Uncharacterized protein n=1 Tax=Peltaster fructicola TaxID=286661 RepID=A0A6H0XPY0_9PEZI|nr:hypothetical protein AMS68_002263 [Peltaster fructicola]